MTDAGFFGVASLRGGMTGVSSWDWASLLARRLVLFFAAAFVVFEPAVDMDFFAVLHLDRGALLGEDWALAHNADLNRVSLFPH